MPILEKDQIGWVTFLLYQDDFTVSICTRCNDCTRNLSSRIKAKPLFADQLQGKYSVKCAFCNTELLVLYGPKGLTEAERLPWFEFSGAGIERDPEIFKLVASLYLGEDLGYDS